MEKIQNNIIKKKKLGIISNGKGGTELLSSWLMKKKNYCNFSLLGLSKKIFQKKITTKKKSSIDNTIKNSDNCILKDEFKDKHILIDDKINIKKLINFNPEFKRSEIPKKKEYTLSGKG
tara:strand:- start:102 stop:458 length:357 start_codon:yes stop_codon:yes gene_type:complete